MDGVGDTSSAGGAFLRELRLGRGGAASSRMPNSEVGRDKRERDEVVKLFTGSSMLNAGIRGEGGVEPTDGDGICGCVSCRLGGGREGRSGSSKAGALCAPIERVRALVIIRVFLGGSSSWSLLNLYSSLGARIY